MPGSGVLFSPISYVQNRLYARTMKKQILFLLLALAITGIVHADEDPMKSLFGFQQKMVRTGSTTAMMKLGNMYEQGVGTKQNFDKALEMYHRAKAGGHPGADAAIARVMRTRKGIADAATREKQRIAETKQSEQQQRRAEAEHQAQLERQARERAEREARAKARQQALARQRAELARLREAQASAEAERAARARAAATAAAQENARQQQALQRKKPVATGTKPVAEEKMGNARKAESFKSDPCKSPAAHLMSLCK